MKAIVIEGGGSGLRFFFLENWRIVERSFYEEGNFLRLKSRLADVISDFFENSENYEPEIPVGAAFAGLYSEDEKKYFDFCLKKSGHKGRHIVVNDALAAYYGAFDGHQNILAISGTGSIAISVDSGGNLLRTGGWGPLLGDEGSGFWIGREILKKIADFHDKKTKGTSPLVSFVLEETSLTPMETIRKFLSSKNPVSEISSLTRTLKRAADLGLDEAKEIIERAAGFLSSEISCLARETNSHYFALRGGVALNCPFFRDKIIENLKGIEHKDKELSAIGGILFLLFGEEALDKLRRHKDEEIFISRFSGNSGATVG
ncbi:hypothetical protein JXA84_06705 [candidate division WOR-3 bacterium]|nr:hypothetical protein [candidate division WOR-3 bacterium]